MTTTIMLVGGFIVVVLCVAGVAMCVIKARKEIEIERMRLGGAPPAPSLPDQWRNALDAKNCDAQYDNGNWYIVPRWTGERLPKPFTHLLEAKR